FEGLEGKALVLVYFDSCREELTVVTRNGTGQIDFPVRREHRSPERGMNVSIAISRQDPLRVFRVTERFDCAVVGYDTLNYDDHWPGTIIDANDGLRLRSPGGKVVKTSGQRQSGPAA